jgi:hypothetical protein
MPIDLVVLADLPADAPAQQVRFPGDAAACAAVPRERSRAARSKQITVCPAWGKDAPSVACSQRVPRLPVLPCGGCPSGCMGYTRAGAKCPGWGKDADMRRSSPSWARQDTDMRTFSGSLAPASTYPCRVIARSSDGTRAGAEQTLSTAGLPATVALPSGFPFIPCTSIAQLNAREAQENKPPPPKPLTSRQKLARALAACHRTRDRDRRTACERQAHRRHSPNRRK